MKNVMQPGTSHSSGFSTKQSEAHPSSVSAISAFYVIWRVWRPYRARLAGGLALAGLALVCGLALMGTAGSRVIGVAFGFSTMYVLLRLSGLGRIILRYAERLFAHDAMFRALAGVRVWFYRKLASGAAAGLGFRRSGDLLSRLVSDIETLDNLYLRLAVPLFCAVIAVPVLVVLAAKSSIALASVLAVCLIVSAFVLPACAGRWAWSDGHALMKDEACVRVATLDLVGGLREARAYGAEGVLVSRLESRQQALYEAQLSQAKRVAAAGATSYLTGQVALAAVLLAIAGVGLPHISAAGGCAILFVTIAAFETIAGLIRSGLLAGQVAHAAQRVVEIADEAHDGKSAGSSILPAGRDITFENVTFWWQQDRKPVFEGLNLTIRAGQRIAVLGPSGIGKSSLAALLLKVAVPAQGRVTLGGEDIAALDAAALRQDMAWLSQTTHLFNDTIRNNLLLGQENVSDATLWDALDRAEIGKFVRELPDGLDSWVGESGATMSGGQGRRIALARTLLTETSILILDEPATGLDADTEKSFLETLNRTTEGKTVILIAHRLTGVEKLDRVWQLQDGHAVATPV